MIIYGLVSKERNYTMWRLICFVGEYVSPLPTADEQIMLERNLKKLQGEDNRKRGLQNYMQSQTKMSEEFLGYK